jgi:hypothetical protein
MANQRCGKNCAHVASASGNLYNNQEANGYVEFHCQGCEEEKNEFRIRNGIWNYFDVQPEASKAVRKRISYPSSKAVSVPCNTETGESLFPGRPRSRHILDTADPHTGDNFYRDIPDEKFPPEEPAPIHSLTTGFESRMNLCDEDKEGDELIVKEIVGERRRFNQFLYRVTYHGIEEGGDWLTRNQLKKYENLLSEYQEKTRRQGQERHLEVMRAINPSFQFM